MNEEKSWQGFLEEAAAAVDEPLLLRWHMANGADFFMMLPQPHEFEGDTLARALAFPFRLEEIQKLETAIEIGGMTSSHHAVRRLWEIARRRPDLLTIAEEPAESPAGPNAKASEPFAFAIVKKGAV
ncbi:MAG: hypothetical protein AAFY88_04315 [Acidobacteriota bacterium]